MAGIVRARVGADNTDENATRLSPRESTPEEQAQALVEELKRLQIEQDRQNATSPVEALKTRTSSAAVQRDIASMTPDEMARYTAAMIDSGVSIPVGKADVPEPQVIRQRISLGPKPNQVYGAAANQWLASYPASGKRVVRSGLDDYQGEYPEKINDPAFREWMISRGAVLAGIDPNDPDLLGKGASLWATAGNMVAANPNLRSTMTPEEWLDLQYNLKGGDAAYGSIVEATNPISTTTNTQTYTISAQQAQATVDQLSQILLGRMASDAELKKARAAMQKLLTPTVTTTTTDRTDEANVQVSTKTKAGVGPGDAADVMRMQMQRGSEGMAFSAGKMFQQALAGMEH